VKEKCGLMNENRWKKHSFSSTAENKWDLFKKKIVEKRRKKWE